MRALLDVNALIALHDPQHIHHEWILQWFEREDVSEWASCPLTQNGCLRVMCQPSYTNPWTFSELAPVLAASVRSKQHRFWPDDLSLLDQGLLRQDRIHGHRQLTDIYLLMLAVKHGGRLVTMDAGIALAAVVGAQARHLVRLQRS
ncbi:MAG: PIN domain-containing protein [Pseudomonadota bacterium]|nr:PIN domain-containing protein [Pseudomonadota bacterium]